MSKIKEKLTDNPRNLVEWLWRLKAYEKGIYVRELNGGTWENLPLSELTPEQWARHVAKWLEENALPCRIREEAE